MIATVYTYMCVYACLCLRVFVSFCLWVHAAYAQLDNRLTFCVRRDASSCQGRIFVSKVAISWESQQCEYFYQSDNIACSVTHSQQQQQQQLKTNEYVNYVEKQNDLPTRNPRFDIVARPARQLQATNVAQCQQLQ